MPQASAPKFFEVAKRIIEITTGLNIVAIMMPSDTAFFELNSDV
jgi:hypothetical protein